jgi:ABC-type multidrug transport system fused ATPase/permease subunit
LHVRGVADIGLIEKSERVNAVSAQFKVAWAKELALPDKKQVSVWRALREVTGIWGMIWALVLTGISAAAQYGPPLILNALTLHFAAIQCDKYNYTCGHKLSTGLLWFLIALLFVCPVFGTMLSGRSYSIFTHVGCVVRSAIVPAVYEKALVLSSRSKHEFSTGRVVNLFSNDLMHLQQFFQGFADPFFAPFQLAVGLALIYREIGVAMFTGFAVILGVLPLMVIIFALYGTWRGQKMKIGDTRIKLTNEIMNGIRIIKFYAWEKPFTKKIIDYREQEISLLAKMNYSIIGFVVLIYVVPIVIPIIMFYTYVKTHHTLTPAIAFTVISLISIVNQPINMIPQLLQRWMLAQNAIQRIREFLLADEIKPYVITDTAGLNDPENTVISFKNASFSWLSEQDVADEKERVDKEEAKKKEAEEKKAAAEAKKSAKKTKKESGAEPYSPVAATEGAVDSKCQPSGDGLELVSVSSPADTSAAVGPNRSIHTLVNLNFDIKRGQLVAVIGPVGSGKSSLLAALLGELLLRTNEELDKPASEEAPSLHVIGKIAYHQQTPWILNASVKENILFGREYDEERFNATIEAACLGPDIAILNNGLDTEIGEKGINLSGGQKARVSFARAVYQNNDILLLDDPLSAVDAHVGQHMFHHGIRNGRLLKGKTVVLVTHQIHLLEECDKVVVLDGGHVRGCGTMRQLREMGIDVNALVAKSKKAKTAKDKDGSSPRDRSGSDGNTDGGVARDRTGSAGGSPRDRTRTGSSVSDSSADNAAPPRRGRSDSSADSVDVTLEDQTTGNELALKALTGAEDAAPVAAVAVAVDERTNDDGSSSSDDEEDADGTKKQKKTAKDDKKVTDEASGDLMTKEERVDGVVGREIYLWFFRTGGWGVILLAVTASAAAQVGASYSLFWLAAWGKKASNQENKGDPFSSETNIYYLNIYAMLSLTLLVGAAVRGLLTVYHALRASKMMHHEMLRKIVNTPVAFFDTTPLGRILNRFSSDIQNIDDGLGFQVGWFMSMIFSVLGIFGNIAYTTKGTFVILLVPLCVMYYYIQFYFRRTNVELKRCVLAVSLELLDCLLITIVCYVVTQIGKCIKVACLHRVLAGISRHGVLACLRSAGSLHPEDGALRGPQHDGMDPAVDDHLVAQPAPGRVGWVSRPLLCGASNRCSGICARVIPGTGAVQCIRGDDHPEVHGTVGLPVRSHHEQRGACTPLLLLRGQRGSLYFEE